MILKQLKQTVRLKEAEKIDLVDSLEQSRASERALASALKDERAAAEAEETPQRSIEFISKITPNQLPLIARCTTYAAGNFVRQWART